MTILLFIFSCLLITLSSADRDISGKTNTDYWVKTAKQDLEEAINLKWNNRKAKNVVFFIGDGMGPNTVTATRIYKYGEDGRLSFEKFPHIGLLKTYANDKMVPDSACTATALFTGVKTNFETTGVDSRVKLNDCITSLDKSTHLKSLLEYAIEVGMSTGFVTTMRVTHATPSALYAHSASRKWECNGNMPPEAESCKDIARQLIEDEPGKSINVIMGGGRQCLMANTTTTSDDPLDKWTSVRKDDRNLIQEWSDEKSSKSLPHAVVQNTKELNSVDTNSIDYLLGIFANGHMKLEHRRNKGDEGMPSISNMTQVAMKILSKNPKGYFLMVEGGNIDMAHHRGKVNAAINEASAMDDAVELVLKMTNPKDTLVVVTSDHSHTLQINGYAKRGANIFGIASASKVDGRNYTSLSYSTGAQESFQYSTKVNAQGETVVERRDPSQDNVTDFEYVAQAAILTDENIHGGSDVIVYALGPQAHLFHNIHEQNYAMHVISYAASIGDYSKNRHLALKGSSNAIEIAPVLILLFILVNLVIYKN